jgi:hypothetical protein
MKIQVVICRLPVHPVNGLLELVLRKMLLLGVCKHSKYLVDILEPFLLANQGNSAYLSLPSPSGGETIFNIRM